MATYTIEKTFPATNNKSKNVTEVAELFGLGKQYSQSYRICDRCEVDIRPGQVVYITGGSGAGKSVVLQMLKEQIDEATDLAEQELPESKPLVDCFGKSLSEALNWLSTAGLSDAFAVLRTPQELSDGQRYRFRLALAMAKAKAKAKRPHVICIDEFCSTLDRISAAVVAYNVRNFADKFKTIFIVATSHDDLLEDLVPDVVIIKHLGSQCEIFYPKRTNIEQ